MKVSYDGYLYCVWQDQDYVSIEAKDVQTSPINELVKLKHKRVRVMIEEIPDNKIPVKECYAAMGIA